MIYRTFIPKEGIDISHFRSLKKMLLFLFLAVALSFIITEGFIIKYAGLDENVEVDYVVILGAGLYGDVPSPSLHYRLAAAAEYAKEHPEADIVVSGGQGPDELISEAEAMKRYLMNNGISEGRIITEDGSTNTWENITLTKAVLQHNTDKNIKILIVTSEFHMFRSILLARRCGFEAYGKTAPTPAYPKYLKPSYFLREYFAVIKSLVLDWP